MRIWYKIEYTIQYNSYIPYSFHNNNLNIVIPVVKNAGKWGRIWFLPYKKRNFFPFEIC